MNLRAIGVLTALFAAGAVLVVPASAGAARYGGVQAVAADPAACRLPTTLDDLGSGFPVHDQALPAVGTLQATVIYVDFSDHPARAGSLLKAEQNLRSGVEYLESVSGGELDLDVTGSDAWVRMPEPSTSYPFDRGITYEDHTRYIADAIAAADATVDFSQTDVVWVVATEEAKNISYSPTTNYLDVRADGNHLTHAVTFGYDQWRWGGLVLAHETGHTLGLPDLYLYEAPAEDPGNWHAAVGGWDLMGLISGHAPELLAWQRWQLGWVEDRQVVCADPGRSTSADLVPVSESTTAPSSRDAMAVLPVSDTKAVVVENRQRSGYDREAITTGALVYTVDSSVPSGHGPIRIVDATPGSEARLDDAPFQPGDTWVEPTTGATLSFESGRNGTISVTVTPAS